MNFTVKKIACIMAVLTTVSVFTGCFKEEMGNKKSEKGLEVSEVETNEAGSSDGRYKDELLENMKVDATIKSTDKNSAQVLSGIAHKFSLEDVVKVVIGETKIEIENEYSTRKYGKCNGKTVAADEYGSFFIRSKVFDTIGLVATDLVGHNQIQRPNKEVFQNKDLDFMSSVDAVKQCKKIMEELNILYVENPEIYALDNENLQKKYDEAMKDEGIQELIQRGKFYAKEKWEKEDEGYYIIFKTKVADIPVASVGYEDKKTSYSVAGSEIVFWVNKDGVDSVKVNERIYEETDKLGEAKNLITHKEALVKLKNKYKDIILTSENIIEEISLEYIPCIKETQSTKEGQLAITQYNFKPAWRFKIKTILKNDERKQQSNRAQGPTFQYIFENVDAITGEFIE